jgi:hypothetical protein
MSDPVIDRTMAVRIATQLGWEPKREWQQLNAEDIKDIEGWVEFKEAGDNGPVPLGKLVLYISHKLREKNT